MLRTKICLLFFLLSYLPQLLYAQNDAAAGEALFKSRCTSCHAIGKKMIGPDLKNVSERHDLDWLVQFIHSSQTMVQAGDKQAVALFEDNNKIVMPDHLDLSTEEVKNIVAYITEKSTLSIPAKASALGKDQHKAYSDKSTWWQKLIYLNYEGDHKPVQANDSNFWIMLTFFVALIISTLVLLVKYTDFLTQYRVLKNSNKKDLFRRENKE